MRLKHKLQDTHTIYNIQDIEKHITRISPIKFEKLNKFREKGSQEYSITLCLCKGKNLDI